MTTQTKVQTNENTALVQLEAAEIDQAFNNAKDFRSVGEKITAPLDAIIEETAKVIDQDPIMNVDGQLAEINGSVQNVYDEIINNDGKVMKFLKSIPGVGSIVGSVDEKLDEAKFNLKGIQGKIEIIFSGFDQAYESINTSIDLQMNFLEGIDNNLGKVIDYRDYIDNKIKEFDKQLESGDIDEREKQKLSLFLNNVEFFKNNLNVLIGNLDMARKRLLMRLDSAQKLSLSMNSSRPIFKTLLSTALIETSSQKAIDASMRAMEVMGQTIDKMSSDLTDKAIEGSKRAEEMASNPVLSTQVFVENVEKLKNHFEEIEQFRLDIAQKAEAELAEFNQAANNLNEFKVLTQEENKELENQLKAIEQ